MKKSRLYNRNSGFSVVEMLAVVAILVILLGISMVSVLRYRDLLEITELDNAAREIYMAAENRAVLLSGAKRLDYQVSSAKGPDGRAGGGEAAGRQYVSKADVKRTGELLTVGSIDPELMDGKGDFYIVYDLDGGSVTDVFYAKSSLAGLVGSDFQAFYDKWAQERSVRLGLKNEMLVGWYNGTAAQGGTFEPDPPEKTDLWVRIDNGEKLTVEVGYTAPGPANLSVQLGDITLTASPFALPVEQNGRLIEGSCVPPANGGSGSCKWVLDSLDGYQFKDLGSGVTPGEKFTVTALLTPAAGASFTQLTASDENNSLFQAGSGPAVVDGAEKRVFYIECLRHLQNLSADKTTGAYDSGVPVSGPGVTNIRAIQTGDILCRNNETYGPDWTGGAAGGYQDFTPIYNPKLESYEGRTNKIRNLYIDGAGFGNPVGLFSRMGSGTSSQPALKISGVRLVNAHVEAAPGQPAGALMGEAHQGANFQNCWVYWETDEAVTDLQDADALGNALDGYHYRITGQIAGGLVGTMTGACTVSNCLAATLVQGTDCAGGLIGQYNSNNLSIKYSYADCYLSSGKDSGKAAGLIGDLPATTQKVKLLNCYAAGYITEGKSAAGLCLGDGMTDATNVYTVVRRVGGGDFSPLTGHPATDSFTNTYFLEAKDWTGEESSLDGVTKLSFSEMSDPASGKMNAITGDAGAFQWKGPDGQSHPYNLRTDQSLELTVYDYPGLKGLPHYGDWTSDFKGTSLVYYEKYKDGSLGVAGGNITTLKNDKIVVSDGYAVLCRAEDLPDQTEVSIEYAWSEDGVMEGKTGKSTYRKGSLGFTDDTNRPDYIVWKNPDGENIHLYLFLEPVSSDPAEFDPEKLSNSGTGESSFYRYLNASVKAGSGTNAVEMSTRAFYNPHFAETVVPITANYGSIDESNVQTVAGTLAKDLTEIKIRTPWHLYGLSRFEVYYTRRGVAYRQVLDLDYAAYTWYDEQDPAKDGELYVQQPIGRYGEAFAGTYDGGCRVIKNVVPEVSQAAQRQYAGLFGYSTGTLKNIVYQMDPKHQVILYLGNSAQNLYVGALAGGSAGLIENCAVSGVNLRAGASGVVLYAGGLVGQNSGIIRGCAAESARLSANCFRYASIYMGGLVGENAVSRSVTGSYAVGRIDAEIDATVKTARICGFVGWNYGSVTNCYAAVDLSASGGNVDAYGFCGMRAGSQSGNAYLDHGSFSYRGTAYGANYHRTDDRAQDLTYARLTGADEIAALGMGTARRSPDRVDEESELFPYPAAVRDENGQYVHYGRWPEPIPLGEMGVFYWEKMVDASDGESSPSYHMSALAVDPREGKRTVIRRSTLSEKHNDGRVVTEYGYGYYVTEAAEGNVAFKTDSIGYQTQGGAARSAIAENGKPLEKHVNIAPNDNLKKISPIELAGSKGAAEDLKKQMSASGDYSFYCWTSYHEGGRPSLVGNIGYGDMNVDRWAGTTQGLSIRDSYINNNGSGTLILEQTSGTDILSVEFGINPLFADSMSVSSKGGLTLGEGVSEGMPGKTEGNPFKIRCGAQLQQLNWMNGAWTDTSVGFGGDNDTKFPYLSGKAGGEKKYFWAQTHDIDWVAEGNVYKWPTAGWKEGQPAKTGVFMGIAQVTVDSNNEAPGWFGGAYNGQNYTIKNLNVGRNGDGNVGYRPNCMGLFGYVRGAKLENMVLFSEGGSDVITVEGIAKTGNGDDHVKTAPNAWYAGGVLAGVAVKDEAGNGEITNCAVAGYTILDVTQRTRCTADIDYRYNLAMYYTADYKITSYDMGGAIGGLVGMTDMPLEGCTASANIRINCNHRQSDFSWRHNAIPVRDFVADESIVPVRVGGLVGSTTAGVTNCYTGGTIDVSGASNTSVYAGRLIGGVGMEPLGVTADTAEIKNCYSYLTLPGTGGVVKAAYNIGGPGHADGSGTVTPDNSYYYGAAGAGGGMSVSYAQLAGRDLIDGETIYQKLNDKPDQTGEDSYDPYYPVTSKIGDLNVAGRFSYAPANRPDLRGMDYPFPTILTQTRVSDGRVFNVHYGAWGLNGIVRPAGNDTVELDMFTKREGSVELELKNVAENADWHWVAKSGDESVIPSPKFDPDTGEKMNMTVEPDQPSNTPVVVTVWYAPQDIVDAIKAAGSMEEVERIPGIGQYPTLPVTVNVTANLELQPSAVSIFPNDAVSLTLTPQGKGPGEDKYTPLTGGTLTVKGAESTAQSLSAKAADQDKTPGGVELTLTGDGAGEQLWVDVAYACSKDGYTSEDRSQRIAVTLLTLPEGEWESESRWVMDFTGVSGPTVSDLRPYFASAAPEGFTLKAENGVVTLEKAAPDAVFPDRFELRIELKLTGTIDGQTYEAEHTLSLTVPKPETNP